MNSIIGDRGRMNRSAYIKKALLNRSVLRHVAELLLLSSAYFIYMFVRKVIVSDIEPVAFANAVRIVSIEDAIGLFLEPGWQAWAVEHSTAIVVILNWVYIITFWPIIFISAIVLYVTDRSRRYIYFRNVWMLSFIFAIMLFAVFPLAPPRFLPQYGFLDTIQHFGPAQYGSREMAAFYNAFAAMPSLHFAWTILFGVLFFKTGRLPLRVLGVMYPAMTFFAITITGNHYIMDAVGGGVIILLSFLLYAAVLRLNLRLRFPMAYARAGAGRVFAYLHQAFIRIRPGLPTLRARRPAFFARRHFNMPFNMPRGKPAFSVHSPFTKLKRT